MKSKIILSDEELKEIKEEFKYGNVFTDGCFCGTAFANFRDDLYVIIDFSCRKSSNCDNSYYSVDNITVCEKALNKICKYDIETIIEKYFDDTVSDDDILNFDNIVIVFDEYSDLTVDSVFLKLDSYYFDDYSLTQIQKKLFKYFKKTYGSYSDAKFKDVGHFSYGSI